LVATPLFQEHIARVDTFLNSGVVRKHAPFGVFHGDLPIVENLLLVHTPDSFVRRFTRREHNIRKALRKVGFQVPDQVHVLDSAKSAELLTKDILSNAARQAGYIDIAIISQTYPVILARFLVEGLLERLLVLGEVLLFGVGFLRHPFFVKFALTILLGFSNNLILMGVEVIVVDI